MKFLRSVPFESNVSYSGSSALELLLEDVMLIMLRVSNTLFEKTPISATIRKMDMHPPRIVLYYGSYLYLSNSAEQKKSHL